MIHTRYRHAQTVHVGCSRPGRDPAIRRQTLAVDSIDTARSAALLRRADLAAVSVERTAISLMDAISQSRTLDEVAGVEEVLSKPRDDRARSAKSPA